MPPLLHHSYYATAAAHPNVIRITNLGHVKLRLVSMENLTDSCLVMLDIIGRNEPITTTSYCCIVPRTQTIGAYFAVNWEGEIELGNDQDLLVTFEETPGVAPTAGDALHVNVGYEPSG